MPRNPDQSDRFPIGASIELDELSHDPFPIYAQLRELEPVSFVPALNMYFVTRYDDVRKVMEDDEHYVVGTEASVVYDIFGKHMMTVEDPLHAHYKGVHQGFFLPPTIRASLEDRIREHADKLIDSFPESGEVELRNVFASRLPILTMLSLFGLDLNEEQLLRELYDDFEVALSNFTWDEEIRERGKRAAHRFHELVQSYLDAMRADPGARPPGSMLAGLLQSEGGQGLSDEEIRHNAIIIFFGGISTVEALIMNTLYALSNYPEQLRRVRSDATLITKAVNETVRWLGPVQSATRHVARDVELRGHAFREGDTVNCMLGAANRDPAVFPDPDIFDLDRKNAGRHVGFATGPHHCLGSHMARAEARIALEQLFDRLPDLRLDLGRVDGPAGYEFRQPKSAVAVWNE